MKAKNYYTDEDYKKFDAVTAKMWHDSIMAICNNKQKNKCYVKIPNENIDIPWLCFFKILSNVNNTFSFFHSKIYLSLPHKKVKKINKRLGTKFKSYHFKKEKIIFAESILDFYRKFYYKELYIIAEEYYDI